MQYQVVHSLEGQDEQEFVSPTRLICSYDDTDSSEDEGLADYKIGGYHPMHIGEVLINRYVIV
jgi:serine/threonine-protein kinase SRPK3